MIKSGELEFWIDLNLPPVMVSWLKEYFGVKAKSFFELGFLNINDFEVYKAAQLQANTIVITTKDIDFIQFTSSNNLPKILYINTGNISNQQLKSLF